MKDLIEVYGYRLFEKSDDVSPIARAILAPEKLLALPQIRAETSLDLRTLLNRLVK
jgi:hypothetical protein